MKKLMIALSAAAAAFFAVGTARGDQAFSTADFEAQGYVVEAGFDASKGDDGVSTDIARYWYSESNDGNVISGHVGAVTAPVPDDFKSAASNSKFLQLDTSAPLLRTVKANAQDPTAFEGQAIGDGIYLDTLVKFTAADQAFTDDLTDGDKIAISFVDHEAEEGGDDAPYTSFVIRAGQINGSQVGQVNYFAAVPNGFNKDDWHRLTVRTIADVGDGSVGFVVYIDETALAYTNDVNTGFGTLNAVAQDLAGRNELYPSAIPAGATGGSTITAAAFSGTGAIDDVVFTPVKPEFIAASEQVLVTFNVDAGVAGLTVTAGEAEPIAVDMTASPIVCALASGTTSFTLGITLDPNGYMFDEVTGATYTPATGLVEFEGSAPTITITTTRNNVTYFDANEDPQACASLSEAFANAGDGTTITLAYDLDANEVEAANFAGYVISDKAVTLDLNGKTITAVDSEGEALFTVNGGASLTVIDSSSANTGTINYETEYGIFYAEGEVIVGAETGDYGPRIIGPLLCLEDEPDVTVVRGYFDVDSNTDTEDAFAFPDYIDSGSACAANPVNGYWFVAPDGEEPPTTFAISWTVTGGATTATAGNFTAGTTIEFTAEEGKTLSFVSIDGTEIDGTAVYGADTYTYTVGTADAELVVTFTQQIIGTYQVTVTPTENATYAATYSNGDPVTLEGDVLTVTVGQTITITATPAADYEYATTPEGWTAGDGVITIEVSEAGTVAIPAPTAKQEPPASTWTVTLTLGEHVTSVSYVFVDTPETTNTLTATGSFTIEKGKSFALVDAVAEEGWEIDLEASLATLSGATLDPTYFFVTPTADASGSIIAKSSTPSGEDWATGDDLDAMSGKSVEATYGITGDLANVDAKVFTTWASGIGGVAYADRATTTYNVDCFLLNIANDSNGEAIAAAKATAAAAINITAIAFDAEGKPVVTAPATYGNGKVVIKGKVALTDADWAAFDDSTQHFFRAELVVDEVAAQEAP